MFNYGISTGDMGWLLLKIADRRSGRMEQERSILWRRSKVSSEITDSLMPTEKCLDLTFRATRASSDRRSVPRLSFLTQIKSDGAEDERARARTSCRGYSLK